MGIRANLKKAESCRVHGGGLWTNFCHKFSVPLVALVQRTPVTPNQLTIASCLTAVLASVLIAGDTYVSMVAAALLIQVAHILDCADGQLARYKKIFSPIGPWLDSFTDRIKEFAIIAAFTVNFSRMNDKACLFGLYALFLIFLYHGQEILKLPATDDKEKKLARSKERGLIKWFSRFREKYGISPFNAGEQVFIMIIFLLMNRVDLFFYVFTVYGSLVVFSYPFYKYYHYRIIKGKEE